MISQKRDVVQVGDATFVKINLRSHTFIGLVLENNPKAPPVHVMPQYFSMKYSKGLATSIKMRNDVGAASHGGCGLFADQVVEHPKNKAKSQRKGRPAAKSFRADIEPEIIEILEIEADHVPINVLRPAQPRENLFVEYT